MASPSAYISNVPEMLKRARKAKKMTQVQLARELGVADASISRIELGHNYTVSVLLLVLQWLEEVKKERERGFI